MKIITLTFCAIFFFVGGAWALTPEMEADRLILAGKSKIEQKDFSAARVYFDRLGNLDIQPSLEFYWLSGQVLFHEGRYPEAKKRIELYVEGAGRQSEFYASALQMLTDIETQIINNEAELVTKDKNREFTKRWERDVSLSEAKNGDAYDEKVNQLFVGENLSSSLVSHINSLLQSYVFIVGKVKNTKVANHLRYSVSLASSGSILLTKKEVNVSKNKATSTINVSRLSAFGVNPVVLYRCSKILDSCTVLNPVDGMDWIRLANNSVGVKEVSKAFGRLIKSIQRG